MSKQKSTKTETQRFSGPELSELLDQVAREHGANAAISAVNKIRSGGVAGFFCREEFEVVVKPKTNASGRARKKTAKPSVAGAETRQQPRSDIAPSTPSTPAPAAVPAAGAVPSVPTVPSAPTAPSAPTVPAAPTIPAAPTVPTAAPAAPIAASAAALPPNPALVGRVAPAASVPTPTPEDTVFGGPRPVGAIGDPVTQERPGAQTTRDRLRALQEQHLDEVSETERRLQDATARSGAPARARRTVPVPAKKAEPNLQPIVPAPGLPISRETVTGGLDVLTPAALTATAVQSSDFWLRLQRGQHELASFMPLASTLVATIGPLSLTTPIVRRLRTQPGLESADVIVLTDRAEIVSEPSWKLVRSGHQLVDVVTEQRDWPTLILIDVPVELPNWVAPLENRLRIAGVGLFRYAVPGNPTADQLDDYRLGSDVPYVIDLISRVRPEDLVDFVAKRHPIASVAGADLNAELLLAMREQVALGP